MKKIMFALLVLLTGCALSNGTALMQVSRNGDINTVKALLNQGVNVNEIDVAAKGTSALGAASYSGHIDIMNLLIDKGADVNANIKGGWTPLAWAAYGGNAGAVKLLLDRGAVNLKGHIKYFENGQNTWVEWRNAANLLKEFKQEKAVSQPISSSALTKEDLANIVQTAVEKASKPKEKQTKAERDVQSDIDKPSFSTAVKIMEDNDLAVVIGIEGYQSLPKSDYSYDDAKLVKDYLKALGFKERNIEFITDERATKSSIEKSVEAWLKNKVKPSSRIFFYYSGHGAPDPATGEAYIVPYDGDPNYLSVTGYPLKRLYEKLGGLPASEIVVVLDACFSGSGGRSVLAKGARPLVITTGSLLIPQNMAVLSATQGSQISSSSPEKGHGIFTYYFLKALKEGKKNISEIYEYLKPQVEDDAKAINIQQSPSLNPASGKLAGRFILRK